MPTMPVGRPVLGSACSAAVTGASSAVLLSRAAEEDTLLMTRGVLGSERPCTQRLPQVIIIQSDYQNATHAMYEQHCTSQKHAKMKVCTCERKTHETGLRKAPCDACACCPQRAAGQRRCLAGPRACGCPSRPCRLKTWAPCPHCCPSCCPAPGPDLRLHIPCASHNSCKLAANDCCCEGHAIEQRDCYDHFAESFTIPMVLLEMHLMPCCIQTFPPASMYRHGRQKTFSGA